MVSGVIPERWCTHMEVAPANWGQKTSEAVLMVGRCEHNMSCPVCGWGWGCAPDPCERRIDAAGVAAW